MSCVLVWNLSDWLYNEKSLIIQIYFVFLWIDVFGVYYYNNYIMRIL